MHSPLAAVLKAAPTLVDEHYADIMPVAWELLLEVDKEVSACAGTFLYCNILLHLQHQLEFLL